MFLFSPAWVKVGNLLDRHVLAGHRHAVQLTSPCQGCGHPQPSQAAGRPPGALAQGSSALQGPITPAGWFRLHLSSGSCSMWCQREAGAGPTPLSSLPGNAGVRGRCSNPFRAGRTWRAQSRAPAFSCGSCCKYLPPAPHLYSDPVSVTHHPPSLPDHPAQGPLLSLGDFPPQRSCPSLSWVLGQQFPAVSMSEPM